MLANIVKICLKPITHFVQSGVPSGQSTFQVLGMVNYTQKQGRLLVHILKGNLQSHLSILVNVSPVSSLQYQSASQITFLLSFLMYYQTVREKQVTQPIKFHFAHIFQPVNSGLKGAIFLIMAWLKSFFSFYEELGFQRLKFSEVWQLGQLRCY